MRQSFLNFNREILVGECGALVLANVAGPVAAHFTQSAKWISWAAVAGTLIGGGLCWVAARIYDRLKDKTFAAETLASDIGYFTPAAIILGFCVYDPAIYLLCHHLLMLGVAVRGAVVLGQIVAFSLFLLCLNLYRFSLLKIYGKSL